MIAGASRSVLGSIFLSVALCLCGETVLGQDRNPANQPVASRARPEVAQIGARLGSFIVKPALTLGANYSDNIFATPDNKQDDVFYTINPEIRVDSDWNNHSLSFLGDATIFQYTDNTSENVEDFSLTSSGVLDITRDSYLSAGVTWQKQHEERGDPDDVNGDEPTKFFVLGGEGAYFQRFNRLATTLSGSARKLDYLDTAAPGGSINEDDRDRWQYSSSLRLSYNFSPGYDVFLQPSGHVVRYEDKPDDDGFDRDNQGVDFLVGLSLDLTGVISGDIGAGVQYRTYEDDAFDDETRPFGAIGLTWLATPLTTVGLNLSSRFEETTEDNASSRLETDTRITVDHELLRTVLLNGQFGYSRSDFLDTNRQDNSYEVQVGLKYLVNRYFYLTTSYNFFTRNSDEADEDYTRNLFLVEGRIQY